MELQNENPQIIYDGEMPNEVDQTSGDIIFVTKRDRYESEAAVALNKVAHQESGAAAASLDHESDVVFSQTTDLTDVVQDSSNDDTTP